MPSRASAHELGVDAVRYSFIVMDLHHLLLAGLPAHSAIPPKAVVDRYWLRRQRAIGIIVVGLASVLGNKDASKPAYTQATAKTAEAP